MRAGTEAVALLDRVTDSLEALATPILEAMGREGMPSEMVRALIGGVQKVMHKHLYRGEPEQLVELAPQLWDWLLLYPPPPGPLRGPRRRVLRPLPFEERQAASNPSERLLRGAGGGRRGEGLSGDDDRRHHRACRDLLPGLL